MDILPFSRITAVLLTTAHLTLLIGTCFKKQRKRKNVTASPTPNIAAKSLSACTNPKKEENSIQENHSLKSDEPGIEESSDNTSANALNETSYSAKDSENNKSENTVEKSAGNEPKDIIGVTEKDVKEALNTMPAVASQEESSRISANRAQISAKVCQDATLKQPDVFTQQLVPEIPVFAIRRETLPATMTPNQSVSLWSILKSALGKDLTRITVPVQFNEPLSFLQRLAEYMEHSNLIDQALQHETDSTERLELIGAFAASTLAAIRSTKPFNPLLLETYELDRPDMGFRFVAEQVSHHPPVSAFHVSANGYEFYGTVAPQIRLTGRFAVTIAVNPQADFTLKLTRLGECYTWQAININVHNIIFGPLYLTLNGTATVTCHENGKQFRLNYGGNNGQNCPEYLVTGEIVSGKRKLCSIYGNWSTYLASCESTHFWNNYAEFMRLYREHVDSSTDACSAVLLKNSRVLWREYKKPPASHEFYNFTYFTMQLNDLQYTQNDGIVLPRTDSRRRPDMRAMENGDLNNAEIEKDRLEQKQRIAKAKEAHGKTKAPRWFTAIPNEDEFGREGQWQFKGDYWNRKFDDCEDIF